MERMIHEDTKELYCIIFGDSIVKSVRLPHCICKAYPGVRIEQLQYKLMNSILLKCPLVVLLHVGTNNLNIDNSTRICNKMRDLVLTVKKKFPKSLIIVSAVLYRFNINRSFINKINDRIQRDCDKTHAIFLNVNKFLDDFCFSNDGLHLNQTGINKFSRTLKSVLDIILLEKSYMFI